MTYFKDSLFQASHKKTIFCVGDSVRILPSSPKFREMSGTIIRLAYSNGGKGRIQALVGTDELSPFFVPLGRLRKL